MEIIVHFTGSLTIALHANLSALVLGRDHLRCMTAMLLSHNWKGYQSVLLDPDCLSLPYLTVLRHISKLLKKEWPANFILVDQQRSSPSPLNAHALYNIYIKPTKNNRVSRTCF